MDFFLLKISKSVLSKPSKNMLMNKVLITWFVVVLDEVASSSSLTANFRPITPKISDIVGLRNSKQPRVRRAFLVVWSFFGSFSTVVSQLLSQKCTRLVQNASIIVSIFKIQRNIAFPTERSSWLDSPLHQSTFTPMNDEPVCPLCLQDSM